MRIKNENEILDFGVRKKILEEICGWENEKRKEDHFIRSMLMKDQTRYFVIKVLEQQLDQQTIREMNFAISNISVMRKIVEKKSKVYSYGVERKVLNENGQENKSETEKIQKLEKELDINCVCQDNNKTVEAHRNSAIYVKPCPEIDENGAEKWAPNPEVLAPYLYDVVEDYYDRTKPMVFILSNYEYKDTTYTTQQPGKRDEPTNLTVMPKLSDNKDQIIADEKMDENADDKQFIWWSKNFHFTTNKNGEIISGEAVDNPIKKIPLIPYAINQDNSFWAKGGDDLRDGSITINAMISHVTNIGVMQGYGQFYMTGKNLPRNVKLGPNKAVILEYEKEDPTPTMGFANASPALDALMKNVEMFISLLLTTNNLSTSGVSMNLGSGAAFPSGISQLIDKAESLDDVNQKRDVYAAKEQELFEVVNAWLEYFDREGTLDDELTQYKLQEGFNVSTSFGNPQMIMSEQEKLDAVQKRKDLGLDTDEYLVKMLHPELTQKESEEHMNKLKAQKKTKLEEMSKAAKGEGANQKPTDMEMMDEGEENNSGEQ